MELNNKSFTCKVKVAYPLLLPSSDYSRYQILERWGFELKAHEAYM